MKSFFKKLAFVMALAMVVSMVAPAGDAFAAESGIAIQGTDTIVTEYTFEKAPATFDFCFKGAPSDWKSTYEWTSSNEAVATVDKTGLVAAVAPGTAVITITAGADKSYVETVKITVKEDVEELVAKQTTHDNVQVTFTKNHDFDVTGVEGENTVKLYRVFSTEEMAKMSNKSGFAFDEEGNGYQAHYIMSATKGDTADVWNLKGYNTFVDGARYAVVYGPNETSSTVNGLKVFFTAYVGKVAKITISATDATVENDVEAGVPAKLSTKLWNAQGIDLTGYYDNEDETDYELVDENDVEASVSGNEVTFDEPGVVEVMGSYTFYDEDLEEDVTLTAKTDVFGRNYSTYRIEKIYQWTLTDGSAPDWAANKFNNKVIAGDSAQIWVVVVDNRGNLFSNHAGTTKIDNKAVGYIGGEEDTVFEEYGYELVFDSLDPDSLLVDPEGAVDTYKETKSFAVVSYKRSDDEAAKLHEIGVMGIDVTAPRKLDKVVYNSTSFNILKETESEDGSEPGVYDADSAFNTSAKLERTFYTQYKDVKWDSKSEDYDPDIIDFTVTTSKDAFKPVADMIAEALQYEGFYNISYDTIFAYTEDEEGTPDSTSVSFKVKEGATGDSTTITVKLNMPKYTEDGSDVYVDPTRGVMDVSNLELYTNTATTAKLFQVSKANQKVGYFRVGSLEVADEEKSYYVANELTSNFTVKNGEAIKFVSTASNGALEFATDLKENDYVLVVTDPQGRIVPVVGQGGAGKAVKEGSKLGIQANADGTAYELVLAAAGEDGEMEYALHGTYRATVYKINKKVEGETVTKYSVSRLTSDSFSVSNTQKSITFYHQDKTKNVEDVAFDHEADKEANMPAIIDAISQTMKFKLNGNEFTLTNGEATYKSWIKVNNAEVVCDITIDDVDFKIQDDDQRAVINTITFRIETPAVEGGYYLCKVKVNRSVNIAE